MKEISLSHVLINGVASRTQNHLRKKTPLPNLSRTFLGQEYQRFKIVSPYDTNRVSVETTSFPKWSRIWSDTVTDR